MASVVQFTVDDTSPTITYTPFPDSFAAPDLEAGWNPYWTTSGFSSANLGTTGSGTSLHVTSKDGASLQIIWKGTAITLFGNITDDASYDITIDGAAVDSVSADLSNNTLASFDNLNDTNHTLYLTVRTNSSTSLAEFDRALISAPPPSSSGLTLDFTQQVVNDTAFAFRGQWTSLNDSDLSHESTKVGDTATLQFRGTSFLLLGLTSPKSGSYSVTLDNVTTVYSAKSSFLNDHSLLFFASGLDAETIHDFEIVNTEGATLRIPAANATVFAASSSTNPSGTPSSSASASPISAAASANGLSSGTIAALVLGAVMIILVVVGLLAYILLYRPHKRRQRVHRESPPKETHDEDIVSVSVLEVAPEFKKTVYVYDDLPAIAGPSRDRTSRRSGFTKWKEEVEGGLGSWGRSALGIAFRHSDSTRRSNSDTSNEYDMEVRSDSYKTSSSSNGYGSTQGEGKGKGKSPESRVSRWTRRNEQRESSLSPRYKLDLPIEPTPRSVSHSAATSSGRPDPSVISSLSYMSSPSLSSNPAPSVPPPVRPSPYPNTHNRADSAGALLVYDNTQPPEPDDGYIPTPIHAAAPSAPLPPLPIPPPPPPARNDDRGSVREYDVDDGNVLGDGSARIALRSLSPRTVESDQRTPRRKRRDKEKRSEKVADPPAADTSPAPDTDTSLVLRSTSPFQVDFDQPDRRAVRLSGQSRVRFEGADSEAGGSEQGPAPAVANRQAFRLTPPAMEHPRDTSFLDFTSSSDVSLRTRSNAYSYSTSSRSIISRAPEHSRWSTEGSSSNIASIIPPPQPASRWSATTAPSSDLHRDPSDVSSASFPFPVSLPASPHHPEGTFADAPSTRLQLPVPADENGTGTLNTLNAHPADLVSEIITSPTDSVPMSVSDIHFQHSEAEDAEGSHHDSSLPSHPPLPPADEVPFIVQRILGLQTPSTAGFPTPTPTAGSTRFTRGGSPGS